MRIRSKGLGRRELVMDLREFVAVRDGRGVLLRGVTHAPVTWETTIRVGPGDVGPLLRLVLRPAMLRVGLAFLLRQRDRPGPAGEEPLPSRARAAEGRGAGPAPQGAPGAGPAAKAAG